jgi:hypothetical protein
MSTETETHPRFGNLPAHMKHLPKDHRGFPVPWFVAWKDGEPFFPAMDPAKLAKAANQGLCWVCGIALGRYRASVIGPMCAITRTISEPPSHLDCARFSAMYCPFLANPRMGRVPKSKYPGGEHQRPAGDGILRNPGAVAVWIETRRCKPFRVGDGVLFELGEPDSVEWFAEGRRARRSEIEASIRSGLHLLVDACDAEPISRRAEAHAELERRVEAVFRLIVDEPD